VGEVAQGSEDGGAVVDVPIQRSPSDVVQVFYQERAGILGQMWKCEEGSACN
jgi:hypothetical protein